MDKADKQTVFADGLHLTIGLILHLKAYMFSQGTNIGMLKDKMAMKGRCSQRRLF